MGLFNREPKVRKEPKFLICPHCEERIVERVELPYIYDGEGVSVSGCPHCKKVLGCYGEI